MTSEMTEALLVQFLLRQAPTSVGIFSNDGMLPVHLRRWFGLLDARHLPPFVRA
jgi:hypothetical protein